MPAILEEQPLEPLTPETRLFATVLLNHASTCFDHVKFGTIPREYSAGLLGDVEGVFALHAIQRVLSVSLHEMT